MSNREKALAAAKQIRYAALNGKSMLPTNSYLLKVSVSQMKDDLDTMKSLANSIIKYLEEPPEVKTIIIKPHSQKRM